MFKTLETRCPKCANTVFRPSRWRSHDEKKLHPGTQAVRCEACGQRFFAPIRNERMIWPVVAAASLLTIALAGAVIMIWSLNSESKPDDFGVTQPARVVTPAVPDSTIEAAEQGDPEAEFRLGKNLLSDQAADKQQIDRGLYWLNRAIEHKHTGAMVHLGRMYRSGVGALQNFGKATQLFRLAADLGDAEAMVELGRLYRDGVGLEADNVLAYVWFNRAASLRNDEATRERMAVSHRLKPDELIRAQEISDQPFGSTSVPTAGTDGTTDEAAPTSPQTASGEAKAEEDAANKDKPAS